MIGCPRNRSTYRLAAIRTHPTIIFVYIRRIRCTLYSRHHVSASQQTDTRGDSPSAGQPPTTRPSLWANLKHISTLTCPFSLQRLVSVLINASLGTSFGHICAHICLRIYRLLARPFVETLLQYLSHINRKSGPDTITFWSVDLEIFFEFNVIRLRQ